MKSPAGPLTSELPTGETRDGDDGGKCFVVGIASCPVNCRGYSFCWPGLFGAKKVAEELGTSWVMVPRPFKDMREMVTAGAIWLDLIELI